MKALILTLPLYWSVFISKKKEKQTFKKFGKEYKNDEPYLFILSGVIFGSLVFVTVIIYQVFYYLDIKIDSITFWLGFLFILIYSFVYLDIHSQTQKRK